MLEIELTRGIQSVNTNTINSHEEEPENLDHTSIQPNRGGKFDQLSAELIHVMQQVTMTTKNVEKCFDQLSKLI